MKKMIYSLLILFGFVLTGCDNEPIENFPFISLPYGTVYKDPEQPLNIYSINGQSVLDTITVGDTITFITYISGVHNNLVELQIYSSDSNCIKFIWPEKAKLNSLFLSTSDYEKGIFKMDGTHSGLYFIFDYIALAESNDATIFFKAVSNATKTHTFVERLKTPIKPSLEKTINN